MLDVLIRGGQVVDGTGGLSFVADVGISSGKIVDVAPTIESPAHKTIDATGLHVCPGFVDVHSHDDLAVLHDPHMLHKLLQGVTTTIVGNCGLAPTPVASDPSLQTALQRYIEPVLGAWPQSGDQYGFSYVSDYTRTVESTKHALNVGALVAHGPLRIRVMGFSDQPATEKELYEMETLLEEGMQEGGALGLSLGLMYAPGCFATMDELKRLASVVQRQHGILTAHIRGEGDLLLPSIQEMIEIAREVGVPVHISHLKAVGLRNWGSVGKAIALIQQARTDGLQITCDAYPYSAGSTTILSLLPPWSLHGGVNAAVRRLEDSSIYHRIKTDLEQPGTDWDNVAFLTGFDRIVLTSTTSPAISKLAGLTFTQIAEQLGCDHVDAYLHTIRTGGGIGTIVIHHMAEHDVRQVLKFEQTVIGSDGLPSVDGHPHPRLYGTFPRYLGQYVRDEQLLPLEDAVRRITYESARRFRLGRRGLIQPGYVADVNVINMARLADRATYASPRQFADGVVYVLVSGAIVIEDQQSTGTLPGTLIRRCIQ